MSASERTTYRVKISSTTEYFIEVYAPDKEVAVQRAISGVGEQFDPIYSEPVILSVEEIGG